MKSKNKLKQNIAEIIYIKNSHLKSLNFLIASIIYNVLILTISLVGIVPLICHAINPKFDDVHFIKIFYAFIILFCCIYLLDYSLRLITIDIYYECNYQKAIRKQLFSFSNYQFCSAIASLIMVCIYLNTDLISLDLSMFVVCLLFLFNTVSFFTRIVLKQANIDNLKLVKRIIYAKRKLIIVTIAIMIIIWLIFSYLIFLVERDSNSNINNIPDAMYFCFITMTTVGLGDILPKTSAGKTFSVLLSIFGVSFYAYVGSIFVNIYIEYVNKKRQIRHEIINQKTKENEQQKLLVEINNMLLKNLYEAGLIKKKKYQELITNNEVINKMKKIEYSFNDFTFDDKNKKIYLNDKEIGEIIKDEQIIKNAYQQKWLALIDEQPNDDVNTVLYNISSKFIDKIKNNHITIFFSSNFIDEKIQKIIFFRKKGIKSAFLEVNLYASISLEKESAWTLYGSYTNLSKNKFDNIFKKSEMINVMLVKNIIFYNKLKPLEAFGINSSMKLPDIIYLK